MGHDCAERVIVSDGYGAALTEASVDEDGTLWVGNGEYESQVNFCPWCGMRAERPINKAEAEAKNRARLRATLEKSEAAGNLVDRDRARLVALRAEDR